ncbi:diguanylate cyclase (GGDEF) domain-containing protein [Ferrimonas sediminum]|uniref:diguanylate cyclase n=1 Tax=Ferrimonas sediminum TaxID=718193 RepID=A0A1G8JSZ6_9GAMM|nr:GGDEF domain-containing protein [Ferrimonas sediminum]SDI34223.1 diguanylate cyclase (GGDEF) domain-containing protein [Ferrimonas sediminum]
MAFHLRRIARHGYQRLIGLLLLLVAVNALLHPPSGELMSWVPMLILLGLSALLAKPLATLRGPGWQLPVQTLAAGAFIALHQVSIGTGNLTTLILTDAVIILTSAITLYTRPVAIMALLTPLLLPLVNALTTTSPFPWYALTLLAISMVVAQQVQHTLWRWSHLSRRQQERYRKLQQLMNQKSDQDGLTGITNRNRFDQRLRQLVAENRRTHNPLTLVMLDVDYFRSYNDHYGHKAGDRCLKGLAKLMVHCSRRQTDVIARYGGEEFAILLPATDKGGAERLLRQLRTEVAEAAVAHNHSPISNTITLSAGVAQWTPGQGADALVEQAGKALNQAKLEGRNRYVIA